MALIETVYEGMFILDSNQYARDPAGASAKVEQMIRDSGGHLLVSRLWEERRLAYAIDGHRRGTYWITYFRAGGGALTPLNRRCQISDLVLRHLFLKINPRIVETVISHAQAGPSATPSPGRNETAPRAVDLDDELVDAEALADED
jgi:small subunit ribosomal protein S6